MTLPSGKQRARTDQDRAQRRAGLIAAAQSALIGRSQDAITMGEIAQAAGASKGAPYLYFQSKEELFLAVLTQELDGWFGAVDAGLEQVAMASPEALARLMAQTLAARPQMLALLSDLHRQLEANASSAALRDFKHFLLVRLQRTGGQIDARLAAPDGFGTRLLLRVHALTIGLGQMAQPPAAIQQLFAAEPELAMMQIDFEPEMTAALTALITGMQLQG